ncbi:MAG: Hsp70 family protein [Clostridia bacterium]|nr:Hsp70 family protein [Clostridia bacterium]
MIKTDDNRLNDKAEVPYVIPDEYLIEKIFNLAVSRNISVKVEKDKIKVGAGLLVQAEPCIAVYNSAFKNKYYNYDVVQRKIGNKNFVYLYNSGRSDNQEKKRIAEEAHRNGTLMQQILFSGPSARALEEEEVYYDEIVKIIGEAVFSYEEYFMNQQSKSYDEEPSPIQGGQDFSHEPIPEVQEPVHDTPEVEIPEPQGIHNENPGSYIEPEPTPQERENVIPQSNHQYEEKPNIEINETPIGSQTGENIQNSNCKIYGIDLGTTNSSIAICENDNVKLIKNSDSSEMTPSVVFFIGNDDDVIVGIQAKNAAVTNEKNVVKEIKRYIGCNDSKGNHISPSGKTYTPEMISSLILKKLCKDAEQYEGEEIKNVVITVPAYFDDPRRTATIQAGKIAGLNVVRILNEPTAAAIAFGVEKNKNGKVIVYDLGGGTFDVTLMNINNQKFDVIATDGDSRLGGHDFDQVLVSLITQKLEKQGCEVDFGNDALIAEICDKAEKAKIQLTSIEKTKQMFTVNGVTYMAEITRKEFEENSKNLLDKTQVILENVMKTNNVSWNDIDDLIVVGGSTHMPMVRRMLENVSGKKISYDIDPDLAVAKGAAIFASTLGDEVARSNVGSRITINDVTSQSMGVITLDTNMFKKINTIVIQRNSKLPALDSRVLATVVDNQDEIVVEVTEGDDTDIDFVKVIGSKTIKIPHYPKGSPIEVKYTYDPDQIIFVEVVDRVTDKSLGTFEVERKANMTDNEVKYATELLKKSDVD